MQNHEPFRFIYARSLLTQMLIEITRLTMLTSDSPANGTSPQLIKIFNFIDLQALDEQREYIHFFQNTVGSHLTSNEEWVDDAKAQIKQIMQNRYPGYPLEFLIEMNIDGVTKEIIG